MLIAERVGTTSYASKSANGHGTMGSSIVLQYLAGAGISGSTPMK
mgnify:CR=1 FL=1